MHITLDDLRTILNSSAGVDESVDLSGDISYQNFTDLGYDSLALLEVVSQVEKRYGVSIPDDLIADLETPHALLQEVNSRIAGRVA
jgi:act minimal PKS acyl carrier protein